MSTENHDITREAVVWAYRFLLDRQPESEAVIQDKLARLASVRALREEILASDEFKAKQVTAYVPALYGNEPPMAIEEVRSREDIDSLYAHIQKVWEELGNTEPHWSVLSMDEFRQANIEETKNIFYDSGQNNVEVLFRTLERNGIPTESLSTCLEYGCGLGRVTRWLAERFDKVLGYDISRSHLQRTAHYLSELGITNVSVHHVQTLLDISNLPQVDVAYSIIVLQHNPPPIIEQIVRSLIRALKPGGIAFLQMPTYLPNYSFTLSSYLDNEATQQEIEMHALPQAKMFEISQAEGGRMLEVIEDAWAGPVRGLRSNTFVVRKTG